PSIAIKGFGEGKTSSLVYPAERKSLSLPSNFSVLPGRKKDGKDACSNSCRFGRTKTKRGATSDCWFSQPCPPCCWALPPLPERRAGPRRLSLFSATRRKRALGLNLSHDSAEKHA
ncbi:unnamed protein product, partial [Ectocarpus sp. 12 AP-2014]